MAKELPYFKFEPAEYLTKDISFCSLSAQGLFINICSYYWQRNCSLTKEQLLKRLNYETEFNELIKEGVIDIQENNIIIKFLDNQLNSVEEKSKTNSSNGSKGGRPRKNPTESEIKPNENPTESESKGIREDEIKEDKIILDKNKPEISEFILFAKTEKPLIDEYSVKAKYEAWVLNGWKDGNNKKIVNWKTKLRNTLPYLKENNTKNEKNEQLRQLSTIARTSNPNV